MVRRSSFSRNSRSNNGADGIRYLRDGSLRGCTLDQGLQNGLWSLPVVMRIEIQDDAVAQHRGGYRLHIFDGEMEASAHQRQHAPALHQGLRTARRAAVA